MKRLLLASTSTVYGGTYLSYLEEELTDFFAGIDEILFIPYARPSGITHDEYTTIAQQGFEKIQKRVVGLHIFADPKAALAQAKAFACYTLVRTRFDAYFARGGSWRDALYGY